MIDIPPSASSKSLAHDADERIRLALGQEMRRTVRGSCHGFVLCHPSCAQSSSRRALVPGSSVT